MGNTSIQVVGRVSGTDAVRIAKTWEPREPFRSSVVEALTHMPDYRFLVRTRPVDSGEILPPYRVRALPPPLQLRSWEEVETWLREEKTRIGVALVESSLFEKLWRGAEEWMRYPPDGKLPPEVEWRLLCAFHGHRQALSYRKMCEMAGVARDDESRRALDKLVAQGLLQAKSGRAKAGMRVVYYRLTSKGRAILKPSMKGIGGPDAVKLARKAFNWYVKHGWYVAPVIQEPGRENPDLIAYDYRNRFAYAVEVETDTEVKAHPEQVKHNMMKWKSLGNSCFHRCHVWVSEQSYDRVRGLWESLPENICDDVRIRKT